MTIDEMKERKRELGYTYVHIAELSGVPLGTVQKIFNGTTSSPRYETLRALEQVLRTPVDSFVHEAKSPYLTKKQGEYTLEDYYALPDDTRAELIDGVIYDMTAPTSAHQLITGFIFAQLFNHAAAHKGDCLPMISPVDVQLDCDDKTMVEPDILIVCDRVKIINRCVYGAPDFVIEVVSKSTKKKDSIVKLHKYLDAGVREYWIIDPMRKKVIVYDFEHDEYPVLYGFDAKVPVQIWNGECVIDFREVYEHIHFLYERD